MAVQDPFQLVFDALWALVDGSVPLTALVKPGNKIRFNVTDDRDPIKTRVGDADLPELILTTEGSTELNIHSTSNTSHIYRQYAWLLSTGDQRLNYRLFPVQWALFCAMTNWGNVLSVLEWPATTGKKFVKSVNYISATEGQSDADRNRGIEGWSSLWRCEVKMYFATADLLAFHNGG